MNDEPVNRRLQAEAAFQDARAQADKPEARDKYYFLAERAREEYEAALGDVSGKRVLVIGCAEGGVTPLARRGARVTGIDISPKAIRNLNLAIDRENLRDRATVAVMNAENVDLPKNSFDLICCTGALHHLDVEKAIESWLPHLANGGAVVMLEPFAWNPVVACYRWFTPSARTADEHPLKPKDIQILRRYFGRVDVRGFVFISTVAALLAFIPNATKSRVGIFKALQRIDDAVIRLFPSLSYLCWTAVIQCSEPIQLK